MDDVKQTFSALIQGDKPVLVDFSAEWCGPCKMMPPVLSELKKKLGDHVTILKLDIDRNPNVAVAYHVQSVPTLILFQKGKIKWRHSGVVTANYLQEVITKNSEAVL